MDKANPFEYVLDDIYSALSDGWQPAKVFAAVMQVRPIQEFLAEYFQGYFFDDAGDVYREHLDDLPTVERLNERYKRFTEPATYVGGVRPFRTYMLSAEEVALAERKMDAAPIIQKTIAGFQAGLIEYYQELQRTWGEHLRPDPRVNKQALQLIAVIKKNASNFSLVHDLLPFIALQMDDKEFSGKVFQKGLTTAFQKSAFKSYVLKEGENIVTHCPFSKTIGHLANTVLEDDGLGRLKIADGIEPGWMMAYIASRIEEHERTAAISRFSPPDVQIRIAENDLALMVG